MSNNWTAADILQKDTHSSVTRRRLTKTNRGRIGLLQKIGLFRGWLYDEPFINYVDDGEVVEYLFVSPNPVTEITAGQEHELAPESGYSSMVGVTSKRILIAVAQKPTNHTREIPYSDLKEIVIQPTSELSVDTDRGGNPEEPSTKVHLRFETAHRAISCLSGPSQFLTLSEVLDDLGPMLKQRSDDAEWVKKTPWEEARSKYEADVEEYKQWQEEIRKRANRAEDDSVTPARVEKVWDQLNYGEQPHYYTTGTHHLHQITRSNGQNPTDSSDHRWSIFSDDRILIENRSTSYEIRYPDIREFVIDERTHNKDEITEGAFELNIETTDEYHTLDIRSLSQPQLSDLVKFIREQSDRRTRV